MALLGYKTPNMAICIAKEGVMFTGTVYGQQSCTAGRAAFLDRAEPHRTA